MNSNNPKIEAACTLNGVMDKLENLIYHEKHDIKKQALWALSNYLLSGDKPRSVFHNSSCYHRVLTLLCSHLSTFLY